jgi:hypothetical protein
MKKLMIGIFAAVGIAAIGLAHISCDSDLAPDQQSQALVGESPDSERGIFDWLPDTTEYKIIRYVEGSKGRADFREAESEGWSNLKEAFEYYREGGRDSVSISFLKKLGAYSEFANVLSSAGVSFRRSADWPLMEDCIVDLSTVKNVGKEKKYYK